MYGLGKSEEYAKDWVQVHRFLLFRSLALLVRTDPSSSGLCRDRLFICTKFGLIPQADGGYKVNGTPGYVRDSCEGSLKRLGTDCIDLYCTTRSTSLLSSC